MLSHYRIIERLGAGGMGVVYRATDERLNRTVALKVIGADAAAAGHRLRFLKEARAASAFTHPNTVTIHEVDTAGDVDFIVMELLQGRSLDTRIAEGPLPIDDAISYAEQIASALKAAHHAGIVHRDIKPANVMVSDAGHITLLDFGIAKELASAAAADARTLTAMDATVPGAVLGSVAYMSPEQAQGLPVDGTSDVFSLGVLVYEMLTGRRPFGGTTAVETVAKIIEATPPPIEAIRADVPASLVTLVSTCLEKNRTRRPASDDVHRRLAAMRSARATSAVSIGQVLRRRSIVIPASIAGLVIVGIAAFWWESGREVRDAMRRIPAILEMAQRGDAYGFYHAAHPVLALVPDEPRLAPVWTNLTFAIPEMKSTPSGAEVLIKGYDVADDAWISLGHTPLRDVAFPRGTGRLRIVKEGFAPYDGTPTIFALDVVLDVAGTVPDGMIRVPAGTGTNEGRTFPVPAFWMDRFEVTNRQFKAFVDAGGYSNRAHWQVPVVENGREIAWEVAVTRFRDRTGRPGPATWELGSFPQGQADFPVSGVSWYEAAAYAAFAGKSLPTAFQWRRAGDFNGPSGVYGDILVHSNFGGKGAVAAGTLRGIGPFGQFDQAGNVKEWCWNESSNGRMILGGGWNEPKYMYEDRDAQPPLTRRETFGFRLVKNVDPQPEASYAYVPPRVRDYTIEKPIDDAAFKVAISGYAYDHGPLNDTIERTEDAPDWRRETITLDSAYGERLTTYLYLPKSTAPPYQTIVYFPGGDAQLIRSSRELNLANVDFVIRSGRALAFPVYKGTYERIVPLSGPNAGRDLAIARVRDFGRVADYLVTRPDVDTARIGYYGVSLGAGMGVLITAIDQRLKASVFLGGGLLRLPTRAETDPFNFASRIRVPTLMVNGDSDFQVPLEAAQRPLFRALNLPPDQKRHALFSGGHMPAQIHDVMREILDWYDRFLGPVQTSSR
jgi:hypothetical protein